VREVRRPDGQDGQLLHVPRLRDQHRLLVARRERSDVGARARLISAVAHLNVHLMWCRSVALGVIRHDRFTGMRYLVTRLRHEMDGALGHGRGLTDVEIVPIPFSREGA
jgi:hypothetical protein